MAHLPTLGQIDHTSKSADLVWPVGRQLALWARHHAAKIAPAPYGENGLRFAVISDVHGNLPALRRVLDHIRTRGVDAVINLGDVASAPLWPRETVDALAELQAFTIRGNHDRWLGEPRRAEESATVRFTWENLTDESRRMLAGLPPVMEIADEVFAVHGTPSSDMEYLLEDSVDGRLCLATTAGVSERLSKAPRAALVLCGHSHQQNAVWANGGRLVVNPGAVGCPRYAGNDAPLRNEAGSPHARYAVVTRHAGAWSAELNVLDYDWSVVIARANAVGRADWAAAFAKNT
jgi:putative phosphoesterase